MNKVRINIFRLHHADANSESPRHTDTYEDDTKCQILQCFVHELFKFILFSYVHVTTEWSIPINVS